MKDIKCWAKISLFHEVNALPIPLDIRRLNDGEGIESTMKKKNAKYHNLFRKFNNTNLERAQKRHMSPIPSGRSSESAVDNIDHNPSSTTSKSSFHGTGISIFQHPMKENVGFRRDQIILPTSKPKSKKAPELPDAYMNMKPAYLKTKPEPLILSEDVIGILNHDYLLISLQNEYEWLNTDKTCYEIAHTLGINDIIDSQYSNRHKIYDIKTKLCEIEKQKWVEKLYQDRNLPNGNKLRTYRLYKNELVTSSYLKNDNDRQHRRILSNFRSGCLPLAIETGRYTKPKTLLNDRKCKYCTVDCVEDEKHVLMHCEFYSDLRYGLFLKASAINPNFNDFDHDDKFIFLMSDDSIQPFLAKSLYFMFNHRKYCV
ncbi:unnamed protein product [Mytilus coruscus]|uniref:Uncharacterized protein n=1 Tax=Mytilus coruscus TaxID=42192 RepID=A0A6J7ZW10_MYTCO|nr:unnamed protein product [Mytilus coruscus]